MDVLSWRQKTQRIHAQIKDICAILSGLVVAQVSRGSEKHVEAWVHVVLVGLIFACMMAAACCERSATDLMLQAWARCNGLPVALSCV